MSDIFLSYASADLHRVRPLIEALERRGWSVWWDRTILPGQTYDQLIEEALEEARCVVVVWSQASIVSAWVRAEADAGRQRGILVPVFIDDGMRIPLAFRPIQAARLVDWQGMEPHPEFAKVVRAVTNLLGSPVPEEPVTPEAERPPESRHVSRQSSTDTGFVPKWQADKPARVGQIKKRFLLWAVGLLLLLVPILYWVNSTNDQGQENKPEMMTAPGPPAGQIPDPGPSITNSLGMVFVRLPAGEFQMGPATSNDDERPVHTVRISRPFYLGQYEVTQAQWKAVMGNNPSRFPSDPNRPIENVSWEDVQEFLRKLNAREKGKLYRLPTEAEWEYAARAGSTTAYSFGDNASQLGDYAWYAENAEERTHPVGQKQPNAWGLYDMYGNVWEWVQDWYGNYPAEAFTDPQGSSSGSGRVIRGGSWILDGAGRCRSANRRHATPGDRYAGLGFRLLRTAP